MSRPDEYRECAAQCLRLANSAWDAKDKAPLIHHGSEVAGPSGSLRRPSVDGYSQVGRAYDATLRVGASLRLSVDTIRASLPRHRARERLGRHDHLQGVMLNVTIGEEEEACPILVTAGRGWPEWALPYL
jgi:hypothetical protein